MATIKAPVAAFNGIVGGVQFANGEAETDNQAVINYCKGAGYTIETTAETKAEPQKLPEFKEGEDAPAGNASTDEWKAWSLAQGKTEAELEGLGRGEIRALHFPAE